MWGYKSRKTDTHFRHHPPESQGQRGTGRSSGGPPDDSIVIMHMTVESIGPSRLITDSYADHAHKVKGIEKIEPSVRPLNNVRGKKQAQARLVDSCRFACFALKLVSCVFFGLLLYKITNWSLKTTVWSKWNLLFPALNIIKVRFFGAFPVYRVRRCTLAVDGELEAPRKRFGFLLNIFCERKRRYYG